MIKYVVKRFAQMIVVLFIVSLFVFLLTNFIGDPVDMLVPENATLEQIESARARLGLDKPLPVQYGIFIRDVLHGNFGKSYIYGKPAMDLIFERMPATLELVAVAACLVLCIAIPLGVYAGAYPKRASSKLIMSGSILGISLPSFWVGMMMIYIFAVVLRLLPASGRGNTVMVGNVALSIFAPGGIRYVILPAITLALTNVATMLRLTRSGILENMRQDYIKFATVKGLPKRFIMWRHIFRNAIVPIAINIPSDFLLMLSGSLVIESMYAIPGTGGLLIKSITAMDNPLVQILVLLYGALSVLGVFLGDIVVSFVDPRIKLVGGNDD